MALSKRGNRDTDADTPRGVHHEDGRGRAVPASQWVPEIAGRPPDAEGRPKGAPYRFQKVMATLTP